MLARLKDLGAIPVIPHIAPPKGAYMPSPVPLPSIMALRAFDAMQLRLAGLIRR